MLYKEKHKVKYIITEFLFNILNRGEPPTWFKQNRKLSQNSQETRSHFCSYFTRNFVAVSHGSSPSCSLSNTIKLPTSQIWESARGRRNVIIIIQWWSLNGDGEEEGEEEEESWPEGRKGEQCYHHSTFLLTTTIRIRELNFSCGRRLNIGQNNSL